MKWDENIYDLLSIDYKPKYSFEDKHENYVKECPRLSKKVTCKTFLNTLSWLDPPTFTTFTHSTHNLKKLLTLNNIHSHHSHTFQDLSYFQSQSSTTSFTQNMSKLLPIIFVSTQCHGFQESLESKSLSYIKLTSHPQVFHLGFVSCLLFQTQSLSFGNFLKVSCQVDMRLCKNSTYHK